MGGLQLGHRWSLVFEEGTLHIFIDKAICIPTLIFLKLLTFPLIGGPASATVALAALTFFLEYRD